MYLRKIEIKYIRKELIDKMRNVKKSCSIKQIE